CECIAFDDLQAIAEILLQLGECRDASPVPFHGGDCCSGVEERSGESAGTRSHLIDLAARQRTGDCSHARKQLPVEDEILSERLACAEAMTRDDFAQRLGWGAQAVSARRAAFSAAIRIAAAIGRG